MSKHVFIGKAGRKEIGFDLRLLVTTRLLIQANSGGGKSWLIRVLCEQAFGKVQVIIIDREGEFSTLREKFDYVLVGKGGETPADPRSAEMLAHKLLELNASAVCDLYEMKDSDRHLWVKLFLEALLDAPKRLWHPVLVIVDEAHIFAPEKGAGESIASDAVIGLATRGRKRGFCAVFATQRLGKLRKDAAAELLNVLIGQTFIDIDVKRALEALGIPKEDKNEVTAELKTMEPGNFFAFGRAITKERKLVSVGKVTTTHPEPGSYKHAAAPPPAPAKIKAMLPKLADLPKEAEAKAQTEKELRQEIRSLRGMLNARPPMPKVEVQKVGMPPNEVRRMVNQIQDQFRKDLSTAQAQTARLLRGILSITEITKRLSGEKIIEEAQKNYGSIERLLKKIPAVEIQKGGDSHVSAVRSKTGPVSAYETGGNTPRSDTSSNNGDVKLRAGAERMLAALAQWAPQGMALGQMRSHAGLKKSGTFTTYLSDLRRNGFIREENGMLYATDSALEYCKHVPPAPQTTEEVLTIWNPKLRDGARRMLQVLVSHGGEAISKNDLGLEAGLKKSGTFTTYLSDLRTARLITVERDMVAANKETLFL